jgi:hypothetical protein
MSRKIMKKDIWSQPAQPRLTNAMAKDIGHFNIEDEEKVARIKA